jgi:hypothetical protein
MGCLTEDNRGRPHYYLTGSPSLTIQNYTTGDIIMKRTSRFTATRYAGLSAALAAM